MPEQIDLDKTLEELRKLLHEYSDLAIDLGSRHQQQLTETMHKIHELKSQADHLKYMLEEKQNLDAANNQNFLLRHAAALQHALNHHFLIARQFEVARTAEQTFEAEMQELEEIYKELWRLYETLREQQEMKQHLQQQQLQTRPDFYPSPSGSHRDEE